MTFEHLMGIPEETLRSIADHYGVDNPHGRSREELARDVIDVLDDIDSDGDRGDTYTVRIQNTKFEVREHVYRFLRGDDSEIDALPSRYNLTRVDLLLRDPGWGFVCWELADEVLRELAQETRAELVLRIQERDRDGGEIDHFDVLVGEEDHQRYVNLPKERTRYGVSILLARVSGERLLASSQVVAVPAFSMPDVTPPDSVTDRIIALSGVRQLGIPEIEKRIPQRVLRYVAEEGL